MPVLTSCEHCMNPLVLSREGPEVRLVAPEGGRDIRDVAREGSIGAELITMFPEAIERLPVWPEVAQRALEAARNPESSTADLAAIIQRDQAITLRVLKVANSAFYGGLEEIKDLKTACSRLGLKKICGVVLAIANGPVYRVENPAFRGTMRVLWRHALASAHCAYEIANMLAEPGADTFYVAGLVHDVGKVLLLGLVADEEAEVAETLRQSPELFAEVLEGYSAFLGFHIVRRWNLPAEFAIAVYCHAHVEATPDDQWLSLVHTVALASEVANVSGFGLEDTDVSLVSHPSNRFLGLSDMKLATLRVDIEDELAPLLSLAPV